MKQLFTVLTVIIFTSAPAAAKEYVDLELVIATDVSRSIDEEEGQLQREGVAAAFRSAEVIKAISTGVLQRIAVAYLDYSSRDWNKVVLDWRIIKDQASAYAFADDLLKSELTFGRRTSISDAIRHAVDIMEANDIEGTRQVIDVSGDGPNNFGGLVVPARDAAIAKRITINGLPIINDNGGIGSRYNLADLDLYYRGCVVGGPGAFIVVARSFPDFARAIRRKLVLEIANLAPAAPPPPRARFMRAAASFPRIAQASPTGYTYEKGCDIGERMRESYFMDDN